MNKLMVTIGDLTPLGYKLPKTLTFENWVQLGNNLGTMRRVTPFAMGDWLEHGEQSYGEKYSQAADALGVDPIVLQVCQRVCARFPYEDRFPWPVEFKHHQAVAHLPEEQATAYLKMVQENQGMSLPTLKGLLLEGGDQPETASRTTKKYYRLVCQWDQQRPPKKVQEAIFKLVKDSDGEVEVKIKE